MTVESDATVIYAMVFGGSGGAAPVSGVSVGAQALTKVKSITGPNALVARRVSTRDTGHRQRARDHGDPLEARVTTRCG